VGDRVSSLRDRQPHRRRHRQAGRGGGASSFGARSTATSKKDPERASSHAHVNGNCVRSAPSRRGFGGGEYRRSPVSMRRPAGQHLAAGRRASSARNAGRRIRPELI
jgi:hypothetical protein